jgi:transcription elongation factor GreA
MAEKIYLTKEGYEKLRAELDHIRTTKRKEIAKTLQFARALGDLRENAEYHMAKEALTQNELRIAELTNKLSRVEIVDNSNIATDKVLIGAKVKMKDLIAKEEITYQIVCQDEADYEKNKISVDSPLGKGLLGAKEGEEVEITVPNGKLKYKILKITR